MSTAQGVDVEEVKVGLNDEQHTTDTPSDIEGNEADIIKKLDEDI